MSARYVLDGHEPRNEPNPKKWAMWFETADRRVARTMLLDGSVVSTVFLGLDHQFGNGPPLLFETCVFYAEETQPATPSPYDRGRPMQASEVQTRHATWAEAEVGHMAIVEEVTAALAAWMPKVTP